MNINPGKSQILHVRNLQRKRCEKDLVACDNTLQYVSDYKYLGCWVNEFVNNKKIVEALTAAAGRSFGTIINIFKNMGDMGYETFCTLYHSYVLPVANYAAGVWEFKNYPAPQVSTWIEMDWLNMVHVRRLEMMCLMNRIAQTSESRLPKKILRWDIIHGSKSWMGEILQVCHD